MDIVGEEFTALSTSVEIPFGFGAESDGSIRGRSGAGGPV
jgi:hypothetical protein